MRVEFTLTGLTPLLMHADNIEEADRLEAWRKAPENKGKNKAGDDRYPAWTWQSYLYHDGEHVTIPTDNLMASLRQAGAKVLLPNGKNGKTCKEITQSGMRVDQEFLTFEGASGPIEIGGLGQLKPLTYLEQADAVREFGFELWAKRAHVGQAKHVRVRPRFRQWSATGSLTVIDDILTFDLLSTIFDYAANVGLCDWRPGSPRSPGVYGIYSTKLKKR